MTEIPRGLLDAANAEGRTPSVNEMKKELRFRAVQAHLNLATTFTSALGESADLTLATAAELGAEAAKAVLDQSEGEIKHETLASMQGMRQARNQIAVELLRSRLTGLAQYEVLVSKQLSVGQLVENCMSAAEDLLVASLAYADSEITSSD